MRCRAGFKPVIHWMICVARAKLCVLTLSLWQIATAGFFELSATIAAANTIIAEANAQKLPQSQSRLLLGPRRFPSSPNAKGGFLQ